MNRIAGLEIVRGDQNFTHTHTHTHTHVGSSGLVVIILASGSEVRGFDPGRGQWIFSERKSPEYDFLRKGSKVKPWVPCR